MTMTKNTVPGVTQKPMKSQDNHDLSQDTFCLNIECDVELNRAI